MATRKLTTRKTITYGGDHVPGDAASGIFTYEEAAAFARVSEMRLLRAKRAGELPSISYGPKCVRFRRTDLQAWINGFVVTDKVKQSEDALCA
jgi:excisionase family DNA binding protein